jgi:hypothetical protein
MHNSLAFNDGTHTQTLGMQTWLAIVDTARWINRDEHILIEHLWAIRRRCHIFACARANQPRTIAQVPLSCR